MRPPQGLFGLAVLAVVGVPAAAVPPSPSPYEPVRWRDSASLGVPWQGELRHGVVLPAEGRTFFTWNPIARRSPSPAWRRHGHERLVRLVLRVLDEFARAHPEAPRIGIGDLSRPDGGPFGPKHASHQNGLDVDVYYPRVDRRERAPVRVGQVDLALAQDLVDRFVRAGATRVFVGPRTGLRGPPRIVQPLAHHDNHLHVRIAAPPPRRLLLGRSHAWRPIHAYRLGDPASPRKVVVVGCIHGDECEGMDVTRLLLREGRRLGGADVWVVPDLNPDGHARGTRQNGRGVDLNRNFPSQWLPIGRRWDPQYSGPGPLSEREARIARRLILRLRPVLTIWYHQPQALVRAWGPSVPAARRYARLAGVPYRSLRWPNGTAPNWQNHRFPGAPAFVVELPPGPLPAAAARRHARAVVALAIE